MLVPPVFWSIPVVLGRSSLWLDLHYFLCIVRGWPEAFPILTFQKLKTHVIKNGEGEGRREEQEKVAFEQLHKTDSVESRKCSKV